MFQISTLCCLPFLDALFTRFLLFCRYFHLKPSCTLASDDGRSSSCHWLATRRLGTFLAINFGLTAEDGLRLNIDVRLMNWKTTIASSKDQDLAHMKQNKSLAWIAKDLVLCKQLLIGINKRQIEYKLKCVLLSIKDTKNERGERSGQQPMAKCVVFTQILTSRGRPS